MTRENFIAEITTFSELIDFCRDNDMDICDDIVNSGQANDMIMEMISNGEFENWRNLYRYLDNIPYPCGYYRVTPYDRFVDADLMFEEYKSDAIAYIDSGEGWDEEDDEDEVAERDTKSDTDEPIDDEEDEEINLCSFTEIL